MLPAAELLARLAADFQEEVSRGSGPVKWCKRCSRRHPPRSSCGLSQALVPAKSERMVRRWVRV